MKLLAKRERNISVKKASTYAIVINSMEIGLIVALLFVELVVPEIEASPLLVRMILVIACLVVIWGATVDIREAVETKRLLGQLDDMDDTIDAMSTLNNTLRAQRHDFLNHLQVVYSLMEMEEYGEANVYIEKIYGRITAVSRVMKTANAAVNALLQVKVAACEKAGVKVHLDITSAWKELPMPAWEMCKVLSNLIDNALDALEEKTEGEKRLEIALTENLKAYCFSVSNNGPMIPPESQESIFEPGVTTKSDGHGMGLYIVKRTLQDRGGDICLESDAERTTFNGFVPKELDAKGLAQAE